MLSNKLKKLKIPQPVAIIGAGVTGKSYFDLLQIAGIDGCVFDERDSVSENFVNHVDKVKLGEFHEDTFADFGTILLSPGVDTRRDCFALVQNKIITDIELFAQLTEKPIIGVTGSNGKSTVVTLIHDVTKMASKNYALCGNIGLPVLQALVDSEATPNTNIDGYIIELSSYHLERAPSLHCAIGVWLNVCPDHLDRYDSYEDYVATKAKLLSQSDHIIANADDPKIDEYIDSKNHNADFFSHRYHVQWFFENGHIHDEAGKPVFALKDFAQIGNHHADNLMAVFAVARFLGIDEQVTALACKAFKPLPSRAVVVGEHNGATFINDSKGTNIGATIASITGIERPIILIAGGRGKNQDFNKLAEVADGRVKIALLFGENATFIEHALSSVVTCEQVASLDEAVERSFMLAKANDVILLSPACSSFDMFPNYLKRGEHFEKLVCERLK